MDHAVGGRLLDIDHLIPLPDGEVHCLAEPVPQGLHDGQGDSAHVDVAAQPHAELEERDSRTKAQRIRDAQHPLAYGLLGKDLVDQ